MHRLSVTALTLSSLQHQHQIGRTEEASLVSSLRGKIAERDREMSLADTRGSEEHHVLGAFDKGEARQFHDLLARRAGSEVEVILIERLDRWEAGDACEHLAGPRPARLTLGRQQLLNEVGKRRLFLGGLLRQRSILRGQSAEPQFVAQLDYALMLDAHSISLVIS